MATLSPSKRAELNRLSDTFGLRKEDHFFQDSRGFVIVTRGGIELIQAHIKAKVVFEAVPCLCVDDLVGIKATAMTADNLVETFGEASPKNNRNAYPVAMAEKRALSRAILKLSGMYAQGAIGEDEPTDGPKPIKFTK